jgi:hypothetical protein
MLAKIINATDFNNHKEHAGLIDPPKADCHVTPNIRSSIHLFLAMTVYTQNDRKIIGWSVARLSFNYSQRDCHGYFP